LKRRPVIIRLLPRKRPALGSSPLALDSALRQRLDRKHGRAFGAVVAPVRNLTAEVEQQFREAKRGST
jgi:hypothetical protein